MSPTQGTEEKVEYRSSNMIRPSSNTGEPLSHEEHGTQIK